MDNQQQTFAHEYYQANRIKHKSLMSLIEKNLVAGKGVGSISSAISEKAAAKLTRIKETFDPMNVIRSIPLIGNYAAYKYGKSSGRSEEDIHYFTGYGERPKKVRGKASSIPTLRTGGRIIGNLDTAKYTSISEGKEQKFRRGDGIADLLARQLNLIKKYHNEEIKHLREVHAENRKRALEQEEWSKNIVSKMMGAAGGAAPPHGHDNGGLLDIIKKIITGAEDVGGLYGAYKAYKKYKKWKNKKNAPKTGEESEHQKEPTEDEKSKNKVEKEPTSKNEKAAKKSATKTKPDTKSKSYVKERAAELKSQGKGNRDWRRKMAAHEQEVANKTEAKTPTASKIENKPSVATKTPEEFKMELTKSKIEKGIAKATAKGAAKAAAEDVPVLGLIPTIGFSAGRFLSGDIAGGFAELALGLTSEFTTVTGGMAGVAAGVGQAALTTRDIANLVEDKQKIDKWSVEYKAAKEKGLPLPPPPKLKFDKFDENVDAIKNTLGFTNSDKTTPHRGYMSAVPQPSPVSQNLDKAINDNKKVKTESNLPPTINIIDKSKKTTSVNKAKDVLSYGNNVSVRNHEESFAWVTGSNVRQV